MDELSVKACLQAGWDIFKQRPWLFVSAVVLLFAVNWLATVPLMYAKSITGGSGIATQAIAYIFSLLVSLLLSLGKTAFYLRAHDDTASARLVDLWHPYQLIPFAVAAVLAGAAIIAGAFVLIIPGIILWTMLGFTTYAVIDKNLGPVAALRESVRITKGNRWNIFLLGLALVGLNILGFCTAALGLLVTIPISTLAIVHAYRQLSRGAIEQPLPA